MGNSVFGQAPEILMLEAYVSSPVVRIYSRSSDFSFLIFLYLNSSGISLKSAFTLTFFSSIFSKVCQLLFSTLYLFCPGYDIKLHPPPLG